MVGCRVVIVFSFLMSFLIIRRLSTQFHIGTLVGLGAWVSAWVSECEISGVVVW